MSYRICRSEDEIKSYIEAYLNYHNVFNLKVRAVNNPHPNTKVTVCLRHAHVNWDTVGFILEELPGCCGVLISHNAWIADEKQGQGLGTIMNNIRIGLASWFKYGRLICTERIDNIAQTRILMKNGWTKESTFTNPKTGHTISLWSHNLL